MIDRSETDVLYDVAVQTDGKIIAVGTTSRNDGEGAILRFNSDGGFDSSFGTDGAIYLPTPAPTTRSIAGFRKVELLANGQILAGGFVQNESQPNGTFSLILALFNNTGKLVESFGNQGITRYNGGISPIKVDLAELPDGKILAVAGRTLRFTGSGVLDLEFPLSNNRGAVAVSPKSGRYIVTNFSLLNSPDIETRLFSRDNRFIGRARGIDAYEAAYQPDGKLVLLSPETTATNMPVVIISRLLSITSMATRLADFDNDEKTDFAVYRPSNRVLYVLSGALNNSFFTFSANSDVARVIPENYNRVIIDNRILPLFIYWQVALNADSPAFFHIADKSTEIAKFQWGLSGDIPVGGDYDGDTLTDYTVFRPSDGIWYLKQSSDNQTRGFRWGKAGDKPVPADYDYDGITDFAVYRPSNGVWYVHRSSDNGTIATQFGLSNDIPLTGDFDGDGQADFAVYRPSEGIWYLLNTSEGFRVVKFGISTDVPVPGDYDGDGRHDIAVFRNGIWYILGSTRGFYAVQWGLPSDVPVAVQYAY